MRRAGSLGANWKVSGRAHPKSEPRSMATATRVEPITEAVHLSIDMQNIFAPGGIWETPWMERVLPLIVEIAARHPARTVFTRFITPVHADDRRGLWRRYFQKWHRATRAELPASELELVPALRRFAPPAEIIDKPAYSGVHESLLASFLSGKGIRTPVVTGAETDVCVLATLLDAVALAFPSRSNSSRRRNCQSCGQRVSEARAASSRRTFDIFFCFVGFRKHPGASGFVLVRQLRLGMGTGKRWLPVRFRPAIFFAVLCMTCHPGQRRCPSLVPGDATLYSFIRQHVSQAAVCLRQ